jgi:hypothetical protein
MEIIQTCKELGNAVIFDIDAETEAPKAKAKTALEEVEA